MNNSDIISRIASEIHHFAPEAITYLYGSQARGDARYDSDIDLLILLPDSNDINDYIERRSFISGKIYELSLNMNVDISPLILPNSIWESRTTPFTINVHRDRIRI